MEFNYETIKMLAKESGRKVTDLQVSERRQELEQIRTDFAPRMKAYSDQLQQLWQEVSDDLRASILDLDEYPLPEADAASEIGEGLYNSERDYLEQIDVYKSFQGK